MVGKMKMRRLIAWALCLCMLLTVSNFASAVTLYSEGNLVFEKLENDKIEMNNLSQSAADLAIEQEMVDEDGMIGVFIVFEGKSVLETNKQAVAGPQTLAMMKELEVRQDVVIERIERLFYGEYQATNVVLHARISPLGKRV
jgi:hypothetical protein